MRTFWTNWNFFTIKFLFIEKNINDLKKEKSDVVSKLIKNDKDNQTKYDKLNND